MQDRRGGLDVRKRTRSSPPEMWVTVPVFNHFRLDKDRRESRQGWDEKSKSEYLRIESQRCLQAQVGHEPAAIISKGRSQSEGGEGEITARVKPT